MEKTNKYIVEIQVRDFNDSKTNIPFTFDLEIQDGEVTMLGKDLIYGLVYNKLIRKYSRNKDFEKDSYGILIRAFGKYKAHFYLSTDEESVILRKIEETAKIAEPIYKLI